ncbi:MAG: helix-turn-helix transcriptional regulator [Saprospiraceae bacterium]|nr:helix-turn-helix transcriptional regulator [Saprospiraceae bacterium]
MKTHNGFKDFNQLPKAEKLENRASLLSLIFMSWIDNEMEKQNMSKKELALKVGTSASYITQLFRGDKKPNWNILAKMEDALGIEFSINIKSAISHNDKQVLMDSKKVIKAESRPSMPH